MHMGGEHETSPLQPVLPHIPHKQIHYTEQTARVRLTPASSGQHGMVCIAPTQYIFWTHGMVCIAPTQYIFWTHGMVCIESTQYIFWISRWVSAIHQTHTDGGGRIGCTLNSVITQSSLLTADTGRECLRVPNVSAVA